MHRNVQVGENDNEEAVHARLDNELGVRQWRVPGQAEREQVAVEDGAPWWWSGDEEASQSFMQAYQGVTL